MEKEIQQAKEKRSHAKAKLTSVAHQLSRKRTAQLPLLDNFHEQLEAAYSTFMDSHCEFEELVSDDSYAEHRIVSGLDLTDYLTQADKTYGEAITVYSTMALKHLTRDANFAIRKAELYLEQSKSVDSKQCDVFCEQVGTHVSLIKELCLRLEENSEEDTDPVIAKLNDIVYSLEGIQVRHAGLGASKTVHFNDF